MSNGRPIAHTRFTATWFNQMQCGPFDPDFLPHLMTLFFMYVPATVNEWRCVTNGDDWVSAVLDATEDEVDAIWSFLSHNECIHQWSRHPLLVHMNEKETSNAQKNIQAFWKAQKEGKMARAKDGGKVIPTKEGDVLHTICGLCGNKRLMKSVEEEKYLRSLVYRDADMKEGDGDVSDFHERVKRNYDEIMNEDSDDSSPVTPPEVRDWLNKECEKNIEKGNVAKGEITENDENHQSETVTKTVYDEEMKQGLALMESIRREQVKKKGLKKASNLGHND